MAVYIRRRESVREALRRTKRASHPADLSTHVSPRFVRDVGANFDGSVALHVRDDPDARRSVSFKSDRSGWNVGSRLLREGCGDQEHRGC